MSKRIKEDEKIEKTIRALLKLPENRCCINCNSLGPQYVCTTFLTFVCTSCSGIHREFTHRVKSVSMSKFNAEEVSNLQAGGNERARQLYFKSWDPERNSYPNGSNLHKLRDFIKHVYVDRRYARERDSDNTPRLRLADKEESSDSKKIGLYLEGFSSPGYERSSSSARGRSARRSDSFSLYRDESPRHSLDARSMGVKRNSARFEIVDDRIKDGKSSSGRRSGPKYLESAASLDSSSRPPELRMYVGGNSKSRRGREDDSLAQNQITESPRPASCADSIPVEKKVEKKEKDPENLIDPEPITPEPSNAAATEQALQIVPSDNGAHQSSNPIVNEAPKPEPQKMTMLEALVFELMPALEPVTNTSEVPRTTSDVAPGTPEGDIFSPVAAPSRQVTRIPSSNDYASMDALAIVPVEQPAGQCPPNSIPDDDDFDVRAPRGHHSPSVNNQPFDPMTCWGSVRRALDLSSTQQHQQPASGHNSIPQNQIPRSTSNASSATTQLDFAQPRIQLNQPSTFPIQPNAEPPHPYTIQSSHAEPAQNKSPTMAAQSPPLESKPSGRMELPADLFMVSHGSVPAPYHQGWQNPAAHGMAYNMQHYNYPHTMPMPGYQSSPRAANPFDISTGTTSMQNTQFPSMAHLQGSLPNTSANPYGYNIQSQSQSQSQSPSYMHQQPPQSPSYMHHQQSSSFSSSMPPNGAFMGQQVQMNNQQFGQATNEYGSNNAAMYGFMNNGYATSNSANSYTPKKGSNPFE
ncbi:hypothetical protein ACFE04_018002 [Oxalis oulophora]